jgi:hypothetical protein
VAFPRTQPMGLVAQTSSRSRRHDSSTTAASAPLVVGAAADKVLTEEVKTTRRTFPARTQDRSTLMVPRVADSSTCDLTRSSSCKYT